MTTAKLIFKNGLSKKKIENERAVEVREPHYRSLFFRLIEQIVTTWPLCPHLK